jgi:predicted RNase H-like nuclease (RuvC/YqgF family)
MKKVFFTIAIAALIAGTQLTSCRSSAKKVEKAQENVDQANLALDKALQDSIQQFRTASEERISKYEKNIADFKTRIAKEKKENKSTYEKKLAELDKRNSDLKLKLANYKYEEQAKWEEFKANYNRDMDDLGKSFDDLTIKKSK